MKTKEIVEIGYEEAPTHFYEPRARTARDGNVKIFSRWQDPIIEKQQKEIEELKRQIKIKDEYFHLIWMIGCDYDGYETPRGLKSIIDELVEYANYGAKNDDKYVKDLLKLRKDEE